MQVVEERPEEDDSTVYKGISASVMITSPTHSQMESQTKHPNIHLERHRSMDYEDEKDLNYLNPKEVQERIHDKFSSFNLVRGQILDLNSRQRRFSDVNNHDKIHF